MGKNVGIDFLDMHLMFLEIAAIGDKLQKTANRVQRHHNHKNRDV